MTEQQVGSAPQRYALYYPYFHFRNERWLKVAALYWPKIVRLIPEGYVTQDSETVRALDHELILRRPPGASVEAVAPIFLTLISDHGIELERLFGVRKYIPEFREKFRDRRSWSSYRSPVGGSWAAIHASEMASDVRDALVAAGLAFPHDLPIWLPRAVNFLDSAPISSRHIDWHFPEDVLMSEWVLMDRHLVAIYNNVLAEEFANMNQLQLTTDQDGAYMITNNWSADQIADILLGGIGKKDKFSSKTLPEMIAFLALKLVVPANLDAVPVSSIIDLRNRFRTEFLAFNRKIDDVASSIVGLCDIRDQVVLEEYLHDAVISNFDIPLQELRHKLRRLTGDSVTVSINVKTQLPASAALVGGAWLAGHPLFAGASAAAVGLIAIHRGLRRSRRDAFDSEGSTSFLLHTQSNLQPAPLLRRTLRHLAVASDQPTSFEI